MLSHLLLIAGCAASSPFRTHQDTALLSESAADYWLAMRWGDASRAMQYVDAPEQRDLLSSWFSQPSWKMSEVNLLSVTVEEPLPKERWPEAREGTVLVKIERYEDLSGRVETVSLTQSWVKMRSTWVISHTAPLW